MVPEIRKILYATDLSRNARYAFGYAASLANRYGAGITVLTVLKDTYSSHDMSVMDLIREENILTIGEADKQEIMRLVEARLKQFCQGGKKELSSCPFLVDEIIVEIGEPVSAILAWVQKAGCDIVVMGAHGRGMIVNALIGSVSRRVVRRCRKPVLVVRLPEDAQT
jgi:nucleotide-binding universal stress UspA family protein